MNIGVLQASISLNAQDFNKGVNLALSGFAKLGTAAIAMNQALQLTQNLAHMVESGISNMSRPFIDAARTAENFKLRLDILLGSQAEGNRMFKEMSEFAEKSVFQYEHIMNSATALSGVMKGGVDDVRAWMPMIADLAAVTGLSIQETTGQVIRMYSAGAGAADLFRERGVLAMMDFKAGVEYSVMQTRKMLTDSWEAPTSKFRGASQEMAKTWDGLIGMIYDKWFLFRNEVMTTGGLFDTLKAAISSIVDKLDDLKKSGELTEWAKTISLVVLESIRSIGTAISGFMTTLNTARTMYDSWNSSGLEIKIQSLSDTTNPSYWSKSEYGNISWTQQQIAKAQGLLDQSTSQGDKDYYTKKLDELNQKLVNQQTELTKASKELDDYKGGLEAAARAQKLLNDLTEGFSTRMDTVIASAKNNPSLAAITGESKDKGLPTTKPSEHLGAFEPSKEQMDSMRSFEAQLVKLREAKDALALPEMLAKLKEIDASAQAQITQHWDKLFKDWPALQEKIKEVAAWEKGIEQARYLKDTVKALDDQIDEMDYQTAIIGMKEYEAAIAKVAAEADKGFRSLARMYGEPGKEGSMEWPKEITDRITLLLEKGKQNAALTQVQKIQDEINNAGYTARLAAIPDTEGYKTQKILEESWQMVEKLGLSGDKAADAFQRLNEIKLDGLNKSVEANIKGMSDLTDATKSAFDKMSSTLEDALTSWMKDGKLDLSKLIQGFIQDLQATAAHYVAKLLMTATFEGIMALVEPGGEHGANALKALKGAAVMGSFVVGSGLAGMAHDGMTSIPENGTWLLKKGERVVGDQTNKDLKDFLKQGQKPGLVQHITIQGGNADSVMEALPMMKEQVLRWVNDDITDGGLTMSTIVTYTR